MKFTIVQGMRLKMIISELIEYLENVKSTEGDIDVVCVTPDNGDSFGTEEMNSNVCRVFDNKDTYDMDFKIKTDRFLYIGM